MARTTIKDIARAAGCSYTTVSHALNGTCYVAPETRERIAELARAMAYRPDPVARALKGQDSLLVGHILCGLHDNPFFSLVARGADQRAQELGYATLLSYTDHHAEAEERAVRLLLEKRVDGIIFTTPLSPANVELAVAAGAAAVMVERPLPVRGAHAVVVDHRSGVRDLTRLLIEGGHRQLAYIGGDLSLEGSASVERERRARAPERLPRRRRRGRAGSPARPRPPRSLRGRAGARRVRRGVGCAAAADRARRGQRPFGRRRAAGVVRARPARAGRRVGRRRR